MNAFMQWLQAHHREILIVVGVIAGAALAAIGLMFWINRKDEKNNPAIPPSDEAAVSLSPEEAEARGLKP